MVCSKEEGGIVEGIWEQHRSHGLLQLSKPRYQDNGEKLL